MMLFISATTYPLAPVSDGGLYLLVDKPGVTANLNISLSQTMQADPGFSVEILLSNTTARFALVGQGPWAITGVLPRTEAASFQDRRNCCPLTNRAQS